MNVMKRINKMRLNKGWSIYRLSVLSGVPQSTLTNMFTRETQPSIATLEMICHAFGISLAEFFYDPEDPISGRPQDTEFLKMYRSLSWNEQKMIYDLVSELSKKSR